MGRATARPTRRPQARRPVVSHANDPAELQAHQAADQVARGGSVSGWSFASVPSEAGVHRQEQGKPPSDEDKLKKAGGTVLEAALETPTGKKLQEKVKEDPLVKAGTAFLDTTAGKVVAGGAIAAGVGTLAATKQPLPFQAPAIPLDRITPGLSAKVTVEGPVNAPTFVGLSLTYKEQGPKSKGPNDKDQIAADIARLRQQQQLFTPKAQQDQERADEQAAIARVIAQQSARFGNSTLLPIKPADKPKTVEAPKTESDAPKKETDETPVQREPASPSRTHDSLDTAGVPDAVRSGGEPLDPVTRRSMEARFGYDFSAVRVHHDSAAHTAAAGVAARAFTVGEDIAFASGSFDPKSPQGRHLLAHELAHVVQQRAALGDGAVHVQRRGFFESVGILLGLVEGTWSDRELRAYLDAVTSSGKIDGSYDADNKARAIVRRWKAASPGWDLLGPQKSILIDEMLDGPTLGDDEECILDLLELSDAGDLRAIFASPAKRIADLDSDIDGDNHKRLEAFVASRFQGGRPALQAGNVVVVGVTVPAGAPAYGFSAATFDARVDSDRSPTEIVALIDRFSPDDRHKALDHLLHELWPKAKDAIGAAKVEIANAATDDEKQAIADRAGPAYQRVATAERVLQHYFLGEVPATKDQLTKGTLPVDPARAEELREVLRPKQYVGPPEADKKKEDEADAKAAEKPPKDKDAKPAKVERVKFHDPEKYRAEVEKALPDVVKAYYKTTVTDRGARAPREEIEAMAVIAKDETDAVFSQYYDKGKHELKFDRKGKPGKLHFWYEQGEVDRKTYGDRPLAKSWLLYYFQSDTTLRDLGDKYAATPEFDRFDNPQNDEAKVIAKIVDKATLDKDTVKKLVETRRGWGGMASGGNVYVDLYHDPDADKDRQAGWEMLQTLVHEYLHTLVSSPYEEYAKSFGTTSVEWNTLIEGVDCVLDEVVWARLEPKVGDPGIRTVVEGEAHAKLPAIDVSPPSRYESYAEAFRLVGLVGIQNVYAAYFLGLVDRIRVSKADAAKAAKAKAKVKAP